MKAVIENKTGFCVFYLSDEARISFVPYLAVTENTSVQGPTINAVFLTESDVEIITGLPETEWKPMQLKVENGAWVDCSAQIKQEIYAAEAPRARAAVTRYLTESFEAQKSSSAPSADWEIYRQALRAVESQPEFPFEIQWPTKPE